MSQCVSAVINERQRDVMLSSNIVTGSTGIAMVSSDNVPHTENLLNDDSYTKIQKYVCHIYKYTGLT